MYIELSYDKQFTELLSDLKVKYGKQIFEIEGIGSQLDMAENSKKFFSTHAKSTTTADNSVDDNSNVSDMSNITYENELMKPFLRLNSLYMLWKYSKTYYGHDVANQIVESQISGDFYINDFHHFFLKPYCFNYSTYDIALKGLSYLETPKCIPAKYFMTFKQQMEQFLVFASNSQSGACGMADVLVVMSYFIENVLNNSGDMHFKLVDNEENKWTYIKDIITTFIYTINQPFKSNQSPFTNISIYDKPFFEELCSKILFPDGRIANAEIVYKLQEMVLDIMNEELDRTLLTFPVTTACFSTDDNDNLLDEEFAMMIAEKNLKFAFINLYYGKSSTVSACCRLRSDSVNEYFNSFGAGSTKIGSLGVVTLNLPRMAKLTNSNEEFLEKVEHFTRLANKINNVKRHIIKKRIDNGNLPMYTNGFMELEKQYNTVGINGIGEALHFRDTNVLLPEGKELQFDIIRLINKVNDEYSKKYACPVNAEQTPSESSAVKAAKKDRILGIQDEFELYSNQFASAWEEVDILDRIKLQGMFDKEFTGGAISHINVEAAITDKLTMFNLIKTLANKGVVYAAVNYNLQRCENNHLTVGKSGKCNICGSTNIEDITRVVGFLVPVKQFNKTRREHDYPLRKFYGDVK